MRPRRRDLKWLCSRQQPARNTGQNSWRHTKAAQLTGQSHAPLFAYGAEPTSGNTAAETENYSRILLAHDAAYDSARATRILTWAKANRRREMMPIDIFHRAEEVGR